MLRTGLKVAGGMRRFPRNQTVVFLELFVIMANPGPGPNIRYQGTPSCVLPIDAFAPQGPVARALDDRIERRGGKRIAAKAPAATQDVDVGRVGVLGLQQPPSRL